MSPYLALDWVQDPEGDNGISVQVMANSLLSRVQCHYSPVKYALRTTNSVLPSHWDRDRLKTEAYKKMLPRKGAGMNFKGLNIGDLWKLGSLVRIPSKTMSTWESDSLKEAINLSKSIENDYIVVRLYGEFLEFARASAHAEGFTLTYEDINGTCVPRWKSSDKNSSLLRNFLTWFWREFELDFTCEYGVGRFLFWNKRLVCEKLLTPDADRQ